MYNIVARYYQLLKDEKQLTKQDANELMSYKIALHKTRRWENREDYLAVIKDFVNGEITADDFQDNFLAIWNYDCKQVPNQITEESFQVLPVKENFNSFLSDLFFTVGEDFDYEATTYEEFNKAWLKDVVSKDWTNFLKSIKSEK